MNRRNFLRNTGAISLPLLGGLSGVQALSSRRLSSLLAQSANDRVLVLVQLVGGNDGLNTLIPLDQMSELQQVRPNVVLPESSLLRLSSGASLAFHPRMAGMQQLYGDGKLAVVQSVGYPNQNRSHFRSTDIWSTASPSEVEYTTGWAGRYLESRNPDYPEGYPNADSPHPLAITLGNAASETCQGTVTNVCQTVNDPFKITYLAPGGETPLPDNRFGRQVDFLRIAISQTNAYGAVINEAAEAGSSTATYPDGRFASQLRNVVRMIQGGLQTKVYVVQLGGFDTHAGQVDTGNRTQGQHADLLGELSGGLAAFQQDLEQQGLADRVLGMTFSEFGRQLRSNGSNGTDHGDAAPLFVFGSCATGSVLGENVTVDTAGEPGLAVPMQYDFRDVYGSILLDWFEVPEAEVRRLIYNDFQYLPVANGCSANVAAPVDLLSTTARGMDTYVALDWQTANESGNRGFEIERSTDGRSFTFVGWQAALATEREGANYHFEDKDVREGPLYYYRLRQLDFDGNFEYSPIMTVRLAGAAAADWTVGLPYPNPVIDQTSIKVYAPTDGRINYSVYDLAGKRLLGDSVAVGGQRDNFVEVRTGRLPAGAYLIRLESNGLREVRRFVVR